MAIVSDQTIAQAALAGGFPRDRAAMAVAVALAESGGNATATNSNTNGTTDYGLWQINSIHKSDLASGDWREPASNARMAYAVYRRAGNSFSPWYAWRNATHLPFMARGEKAVIEANANGFDTTQVDNNNPWVPDAWEGPIDSLETLTERAAKIAGILGSAEFWKRAALMTIGAALLIVAVVALLKSMTGATIPTVLQRSKT